MKFWICIVVVCILVGSGCQNATQTPVMSGFGPDGPKSTQIHAPTPDRPDPIDLTAADAVGRTVANPTIIDTRRFSKQIERIQPWQGDQQSSSVFRPDKPELPQLLPGLPNDLVPGKMIPLMRIQPAAQFPGITRSPWNPPDPSLAVGPNHIIETVNMELAFFGKDGTMQFQQRLDSTGSPGFFEELGSGEFCFDPKCFYDHYANRFVVLALEVYQDIDEAWITIAVSDDDDPHGIWYKYRTWAVVNIDGDNYWVDYPGLGYDANGYYITGNLFGISVSGFGGVLVRSLDKTPMLNGDPLTFTDIRSDSMSSVQVAQHFGNNTAPLLVSRSSGSLLRISAINDAFGSPFLATAFVTIPGFDAPLSAPNLGGGNLSTVDSRIMNVQWRDGKLLACHSVESANGTRTVARWYEVDTGSWPSGPAPTLAQSGEIDLGGNEFTFFPAIYSNVNGNVAMVFANSSQTEYASVQGTGRLSTDPLGTMGNIEQFVIGNSSANGRWGDYFDIALDPADGRTFWVVGEYMSPQGWRTTINSFTLEEPLTVTADSFSVTRGNFVAGTIGDLATSDDADLSISRSQSDVQSRTEMEIKGTSPYESPSAMEITLEGSVFARSDVVQTIELFNYDSDSWEQIDSRDAASFTDEVATVPATGDVTRFVQPGTHRIEARIRFQSTSPRQQFSSNTDQFIWTISP